MSGASRAVAATTKWSDWAGLPGHVNLGEVIKANRVQGAKRIIEHQAIATKLAESAIRLEVARNAIWKAAWVSEHPEALSDGSIAANLPHDLISQVFVAEQIHRASKDCAECFGAMGVMRDMPLWKYIQDARMCLHAGTGVADAKLVIAEAIDGFRRG